MISDSLIVILLLFVLGLAVYFTGLLFQKIELLKLAANSTAVFFSAYIICSGIYFWMDRFQFHSVLMTEGACLVIAIGLLIHKNRKISFQIEHKIRNKGIYIIIIVAVVISLPKFALFGMTQDEGVYQTHAIALVNGYTERQFDFEEYQILETDEQRENYSYRVKALSGLYRYNTTYKPTLPEDGALSPVSGIFHGIPTFPAVLALMGKLFGVSEMQHVQSIFFVCAMLFILFTVENLKLKKMSQYLALSIVGLSPIVLWVMKSALTEGFLVFIFSWFIYLITDKEYKQSALFSALPICAFSFWHVSVFTMIPLFICAYIVSFEETKCRNYIRAGVLALVFFVSGNVMMMYVSPAYTSNNISRSLRFVDAPRIIATFFVVSLLISLFLLMIDKLRFNILYNWLTRDRIFSYILRGTMLASIAALCWHAVRICGGSYEATGLTSYYGTGLAALPHLSIFVFIFGTGLVSLPVCMILIFRAPGKIAQNKNALLIIAMFYYCVILMAAFIRKEIPYCYYYARYLAPFIVVCGVAAGIILDTLPTKVNALLLICSLLFLLPYDWTLLTEKDDSKVEWSILSEINDNLTEDSAIIFDNVDFWRVLAIPVKTMSDADVYPLFDNAIEQIELLSSNYKNIFLLTTNPEQNGATSFNRGQYVYLNKYTASEDTGSKQAFTQFPLEFSKQTVSVGLLKYYEDELSYDFAKESVVYSGFGNLEQNENGTFRWILGDTADLLTFLSKRDYCMNIDLGAGVPFGQLGKDKIEINVEVNDLYIQSFELTRENSDQDIQVLIPGKYLTSGKNTITFSGESWSPSDYGSADERRLLFSVSKITFTETDLSSYDFGEQEFFTFSGFSDNEGSFRWTNESPAVIEVFTLEEGYDYQCKLLLETAIPVDSLGFENFEVQIVVNGKEDDSISLPIESGQTELDFKIGRTLLTGGADSIQLYTPLWSPSDYGGSDIRVLGINIDKIIFEKQE